MNDKNNKKLNGPVIIFAIISIIVIIVIVIYCINPCLFGNHEYEQIVTLEPTCVDDGNMSFICSRCGNAYDEVIPATGTHSFKKIKTIKKATCGSSGKKLVKCKVCGLEVKETIPFTGDHKYGNWYTTLKATEYSAGEKCRKCSVCGYVDTKTIPKLPSDYDICYYMLKRYSHYDTLAGGYSGDTYTDNVFQDAMDYFGLSYNRVRSAWFNSTANAQASADYY